MLKILPIASALLATTTLWGQLEPVGLTVGQTARLKVSARPPDSCAAQLGFLDNGGKPIGGTSHVSLQAGQSTSLDLPSDAVVNEPGQRAQVQPRIVPDPGTVASACQADVVVLDNPGASETKPAGGPQEGIKVHGHWTIDVRNPDGTLASHHDFENSLQSTGAGVLVGSLSRASVTGLWNISFTDSSTGLCNSTLFCQIDEPTQVPPLKSDSKNLTVSAPTTGPHAGKIVLAGSVTAAGVGSVVEVLTYVDVCAVSVSPTSCNNGDSLQLGTTLFTNHVLTPNIAVAAGQLVDVTVVLSFS